MDHNKGRSDQSTIKTQQGKYQTLHLFAPEAHDGTIRALQSLGVPVPTVLQSETLIAHRRVWLCYRFLQWTSHVWSWHLQHLEVSVTT